MRRLAVAASAPLDARLRRFAGAYAAAAAMLGFVIFEAVNPGGLTNDSLFQLQQARGAIPYNDWHPVIMSWNWSMLIRLTGSVASMAAAQVAFAVLASILTVYYLLRLTRNFWIGALGLFPVLLPNTANMWGMVWKDTQMVLALYMALVCILLIKHLPRLTWLLCAAAMLAMVYGAIVRKNSAIAVIPLIVMLCLQLARLNGHHVPLRRLVLITVSGFVGLCTLVAVGSGALNAGLHPTRNSQINQVMLDDLIFSVPQSDIDSSHAAPERLKKKIAKARVECAKKGAVWDAYWKCYGRGAHGAPFTAIADGSALRHLWAEQVPRHIPDYLKYRTMTTEKFLFTSTLQLPDQQLASDQGYPLEHPELRKAFGAYIVDFGVEQLGFLYRGWFGLLACTVGLVVAVRHRTRSVYAALTFSSGILYILTFLPAAPAADYRYVFWTLIAATMGFLVLIAERRGRQLRTEGGCPGGYRGAKVEPLTH